MRHSAFVGLLLALPLLCFAQSRERVHDKGLEEATALANSGDREAVHDLCYRYIYGQRADKDYQKAVQWCSYGAALGIDSSEVLLAELYMEGDGVEKSSEDAVYWYSKAARQGHEHAFLMLYFIYKEGEGVAADQARAEEYLEKAVAAGYEPAIKVMNDRGKDSE